MAITDQQLAAGLAAVLTTQLGQTVTPARAKRFLVRTVARATDQQYETQADRRQRTNADGSRNYVVRVAANQAVELHCWPALPSTGAAGAMFRAYAGTADASSDDPLDGLGEYFAEAVDPGAVRNHTEAAAWLADRIAAGLPAAPS